MGTERYILKGNELVQNRGLFHNLAPSISRTGITVQQQTIAKPWSVNEISADATAPVVSTPVNAGSFNTKALVIGGLGIAVVVTTIVLVMRKKKTTA